MRLDRACAFNSNDTTADLLAASHAAKQCEPAIGLYQAAKICQRRRIASGQ